MHTHTYSTQGEKVGLSLYAHKQGIMWSVRPLCMCQQDFEEKALFSLGSKQPPKTHNGIQQTIYTHQKTWNISPLTIELINISAAQPWLFVQAMRGLMRQSCEDNALTTADYLLKDKIIFQIPSISRALPGTSCYWSEPLETFCWMKAYEWAYLSGRTQMWFPLICCVKDFTPHMLFVVSALWNALYVGNVVCK